VAGSFLEDAPMVTVSARTGEGSTTCGGSFEAAAAVKAVLPRPRLPIDRVFSVRGFGTVVTGTLVSGRIRSEDRLALLPSASSERPVGVRGVQVHGSRREEAVAGQRAAVNVANLEVGDLERGQELVPGAFEARRSRTQSRAAAGAPAAARRASASARAPRIIGRVAVVGEQQQAAPAIAPAHADSSAAARAASCADRHGRASCRRARRR
jgi:selenocysteine-specific elongation factor